MTDEVRNKDDAKGRVKEAAGSLTGDDDLKREGKVDKATGAAKEVGRFGENVGELTTELRRAREGLASGDGKQSSPIEVLLSSLTSRHN